MDCEKCGAADAQKYGFFISLNGDKNPFHAIGGKETRILGRWHGFVCSSCANRHWKRKVKALIAFVSIMIVGFLVNLILFPDLELGILHIFAFLFLGGGVYGLFHLLKQSQKVRGERIAAWIKDRAFIKNDLSVEIQSEYDQAFQGLNDMEPWEKPLSLRYLPESFEQLPELEPSDKIKPMICMFPEAKIVEQLQCHLCGQQKPWGIQFPFVVCWVHGTSVPQGIKYTYYAHEALSVGLCSSCMEKETVHSTLKTLKKAAKDIGSQKISQQMREDTKLLDSNCLQVLTLLQHERLKEVGKPGY